MLQSDLLLTHYDPNNENIVAADGSNYGIVAVIQHRLPNGTIKVCFSFSAEKNYNQIEGKALVSFLLYKNFTKWFTDDILFFLTDHKSLLAIFGSKKVIYQRTLQVNCSARQLFFFQKTLKLNIVKLRILDKQMFYYVLFQVTHFQMRKCAPLRFKTGLIYLLNKFK